MTLETASVKDLAYRDVIGEATDEEAATLRTDENVREWYAALKHLRQEAERELAEVRKRKKLTHRKDLHGTREDELGTPQFGIEGQGPAFTTNVPLTPGGPWRSLAAMILDIPLNGAPWRSLTARETGPEETEVPCDAQGRSPALLCCKGDCRCAPSRKGSAV